MADAERTTTADTVPEKTTADVVSPVESTQEGHTTGETGEIPPGWRYKQLKIGPLKLPWYASPQVQLVLVAFVCFLCPGMFNAVNGLGGGGQVDAKASTDSNTALYATFSVVGFFAGTIANWLGIKKALSFGGLGYCIYIASYLCFNHTQNYGFIVFAGFLLGCCAGVLWAAQGAIMMAYPPEQNKGRYISVFWMIFNMGGVIGSLVPLGQNINVTSDSTVNDGTYIGFIVLSAVGGLLAWTLCDAKNVVRSDGSRVILMKNPTWKTEFIGMWETLKDEPYIVLLFPMFFASNWFYTYHFNGVNLAKFNTRTRALNSVLYWLSQIVGAMVFGYFLDLKNVRRTIRAKACWISLFVLTFAIWGGGLAFQDGYTREQVTADGYVKLDWTDSGFIGPMFLYIFYGFYDAAWQCSVYWFMGAMTNNSRKLANYSGFYKGIQSAGAAITWRLDGLGTPYINLFASSWGLLAGSLLIALPVMIYTIKDTVTVEDDLKLSDETVDEVLGKKSVDDTREGEKV